MSCRSSRSATRACDPAVTSARRSRRPVRPLGSPGAQATVLPLRAGVFPAGDPPGGVPRATAGVRTGGARTRRPGRAASGRVRRRSGAHLWLAEADLALARRIAALRSDEVRAVGFAVGSGVQASCNLRARNVGASRRLRPGRRERTCRAGGTRRAHPRTGPACHPGAPLGVARSRRGLDDRGEARRARRCGSELGGGDVALFYRHARRTRRRSRCPLPRPRCRTSRCSRSRSSRHSTRTTQPRQTSFASRVDEPRSGKKSSGSTPMQFARACHARGP